MISHIAYYLKYRPQTLDELVGQEAVKKTISSSFQNNKLSHAYLFVGPRGTGKTSLARILAKMVNCESQSSDYPCNKCSTCVSITDGSNLDLIEIDAASNRGIEDIRSLRDKIKLSPAALKKKVYIIDEVHMLTPEAFNALLKTLEEPPAHALFILATTEGSKVPQTILSRVQKLDFKLAKPQELLEALEKIVKAEKIDIDEQALKLLVKKSDGSFRDGVKLLDQISSFEGKITAKILEENFKLGPLDNILDLVKNLFERNAKEVLVIFSRQMEDGIDIKEFMLSLMDILRSLVFIKNGLGDEMIKSRFTDDKYEELVKFSESLGSQDLIKSLDILQNALEKLKSASIPSLPLELAVLEICDENSKLEEQIKSAKSEADKAIGAVELIVESDDSSQKHGAKQTNSERPGDASGALQPDELISDTDRQIGDATNADILKIKEKWTFVLETIRPYNFSLEALLRSIIIKECTQTKVYMEVPYSFHQRILEAPKNKDLLESILSDILGRSIQVSTVLGNRPARREDIANVEVAEDDEIIRVAAEIFNSDTVN